MLKLLLTPIIVWFIAESLKVILLFKKYRKFDTKIIFKPGGMPSAHSATVSALTLAVYFYQGFSALFVVTLIFSVVVLRDATLRPKEFKHSIKEVIAGLILGLIIAYLISLV